MAVIRWDHSTRRREASASRKLGVVFWWYQGRGIQVLPAGCCARYQHQVMACSQSDRAATRSGPWRFQDCGFSPPRACLTSQKQTSMDQRPGDASVMHVLSSLRFLDTAVADGDHGTLGDTNSRSR